MLHSKMKIEDTGLEVSCSWQVANDKSINDTLTVSTGSDKNEKEDLENIVSVDTCIHLINSDMAPKELKFNLGVMKSFQIKKVSVVSEARIIELYGKCEEYITTIHADFFDECEDMSVYIAEAELPQPTSECSLKFARVRKMDQMWLYGIHVTVEKADPFILSHSSVNFHNVNRILKDSGHQLTEKAEKCKKFLQLYGSFLDPSKTQIKGPDPQILMKMFEAEYLAQQNPLSSKAKTMSRCLTEIIPGLSMSAKEKASTDAGAAATCKEMEIPLKLDSITDIMKHHVDQRFIEFERKIMQHVDEKLKELERKQNEKLDLIIRRLDDLKNLMNVRGPEG